MWQVYWSYMSSSNKLFLSLAESWGHVKARHMFTITKPLVLSFSISLLFSLSGLDRFGGVMVSVLASSMVYHGFTARSGQTEDYKIGVCCFSAKHATLRRKSKDWLAWNHDNVSIWGDMSTCGLLFQWASTKQIQLSMLV
jgi:hypothetical protein